MIRHAKIQSGNHTQYGGNNAGIKVIILAINQRHHRRYHLHQHQNPPTNFNKLQQNQHQQNFPRF